MSIITKNIVFASALLLGICLAATASEVPLFIIAGQSNAVGAATSVNELPVGSPYRFAQPNVLFFGPNFETPTDAATWAPLLPETELTQAIAGLDPGTHGFGPEISLGREISNTLLGGAKVALVKLAVGGTTLALDNSAPSDGPEYRPDWNLASSGELYDQMIARVTASLAAPFPGGDTLKVAGFFWMQGENDASDGSFNPLYQPAGAATAYESNLSDFIRAIRTDLGIPDLPFIIGQVQDFGFSAAAVREAQLNVAQTVANTGLTLTDDLERSSLPGDSIHLSTQGTVELGIRFAETYGQITDVPEPSSAALALLCAFGLVATGRKSRS